MANLQLTKNQVEFLEKELNKKGILFESIYTVDIVTLRDLCRDAFEEEEGPGVQLDENDNWIEYEASPDYDEIREAIAENLWDYFDELLGDAKYTGYIVETFDVDKNIS